MAESTTPKFRSEEFPIQSRPAQRESARQRRRAYPYRFPRDHRQMTGHFTVAENARRLLHFFYFEGWQVEHILNFHNLSIWDSHFLHF